MAFKEFANLVNTQFNKLAKNDDLYLVDVDNDTLWNTYLDSFPEGTNEIFRENREHDCSCCRNFIKEIAGVVAINKDTIESIWDIDTSSLAYEYQVVTKVMKDLVHSHHIMSLYLRNKNYGTKVSQITTPEKLEDGSTIDWNHFFCLVPETHTSRSKAEVVGKTSSQVRTFKRGLEELSLTALESVKDLITENTIYRGEEHKESVNTFYDLKKQYLQASDKNIFLWKNYKKGHAFRNSVIGTLVQDISNGVDLEQAVKAFETKVAPHNYKRPSAIITKKMVENATTKIKQLGLEDSLERRHATLEDVSVNDVLFADHSAKSVMKDTLTDMLLKETKPSKQSNKNTKKVTWEDFQKDILPKISSMEALVQNDHLPNFVNITAPVHPDAPNILCWGNLFAWSYNGGLTDSSIKERVKSAGGNVTGVLRASLAWFNTDDLDIHVTKKDTGEHIYYAERSLFNATLDVDMNVRGESTTPVENVIWPTNVPDGTYHIEVHNYTRRNTHNTGFEVELESNGSLTTLSYDKAVRHSQKVTVASIKVKNNQLIDIQLGKDISSSSQPVTNWNIKSQEFVPVEIVMNSPNYWESGNQQGNKHVFFILQDCSNPDSTRGLYNEYLLSELNEHRKVFEVLGSKMQIPPSSKQLAGLGFSSTQQNKLEVRVRGEINSNFLINFK